MTDIKIRNNLLIAVLLFLLGLLTGLYVLMGLSIIPLVRACYLDIVYNMAIEKVVREIFGDDTL